MLYILAHPLHMITVKRHLNGGQEERLSELLSAVYTGHAKIVAP